VHVPSIAIATSPESAIVDVLMHRGVQQHAQFRTVVVNFKANTFMKIKWSHHMHMHGHGNSM
jgi:hypothetical protein